MAKRKTNKPKVTGDDILHTIAMTNPSPDEDSLLESAVKLIPKQVAVLPIRDTVLFPGTVMPLSIGREKSIKLVDTVLPDQKMIITVCQKDGAIEDPTADDLYDIGTATMVLKLLKVGQGQQNIIVHGLARVKIDKWISTKPYFLAKVHVIPEQRETGKKVEAMLLNIRNLATKIIEMSPNIPDEAIMVLNNIDQPGALGDFLASNLHMDVIAQQRMLEEPRVNRRLRKIGLELQRRFEILKLSQKIQDQAKASITKTQREYFLNEQLKSIQSELGMIDDKSIEIKTLKEKIDSAAMPEPVESEVVRELGRLEKIPTASPEYNVIRTYLDWMTELPWSKFTDDNLNISRASRILNRDHYGLEKVKRRILESLAVRKLVMQNHSASKRSDDTSHSPILCFVGPPGVGKTSLGQSIARAMGRKFIRMSLGGLRDEAELRGHRRTYIGAMPGRIIQEIRKAGTSNPVFMLDELDKVGADFRGDPTAALIEILDPAQNSTFQDHYLNVQFDLSKVLFIATANYMEPIPPALRDRMEVIEISGYTRGEKLQIARKYLVRRQLADNGLRASQVLWSDAAIKKIIGSYTREAGVRELERRISAVCRAVAARVAQGKSTARTITGKQVEKVLGPRQYESELALRTSSPGVATGLAYTPTGGEIIFIEATSYKGKGRLSLTGQIGDVMKESAQAALSLIKSHYKELGLDEEQLAGMDIHIHVPAGAVPKDGPSAGVAMFVALSSLLTNRSVRHDVAMTGEITLRGMVLAVGGIKEKVLAARRAGIKSLIIPESNRKDLIDVPAEAKKEIKFNFIRKVDQAMEIALVGASRTRRRN